MADDGDPNLPTYAATDDNDLVAWIDRMAARADELGLPLTHPRFNTQIVWTKKDNVTVGRRWAGTLGYIVPAGAAGAGATEPPELVAALEASETAAALLQDQKTIIETFFRLVRMGQTGLVVRMVQKGLVSPDVTDGAGYETMYGMQYIPEDKAKEQRADMARRRKTRGTRQTWWQTKSSDVATNRNPKDTPASLLAPPLTSTNRGDPWNGATPLLTAVEAGDAAMVRVLVHLGADINRMARPPDLHRATTSARPSDRGHGDHGMDDALDRRVRRTPLMLAAAQGRIALVRLFFEELHADDALVAPDGYHALRLAAEGRHRATVALLPARRGGAWARFATRHGRAMQRIAKAGRSIVWFTTTLGQVVLWHVPKFVLWTVPNELLVQPLGRGSRYLWQHRKIILPAMCRFVQKLPRRLWTGLKDVSKFLWEMAKGLAQMTVAFIQHIPKALNVAGAWLVATLKTAAGAIAHAGGRALSAIHTAVTAIATFFHTITLADVLRGFQAAGRAVFVGLPMAVWTCVLLLGAYAVRAAHVLFGGVAFVIYLIALILVHIAMFVPRQLWRILTALGSYISGAFHEVVVWFDPKRV
ncbi:hypothetical protein SPBR_02622 [Sporothrix brasiliensis 5110]|uniref:Uncharacterized protein n=1 Tax=Sporothrix brasiliensis 5110 TaxID=1398154 RepID=A0A0C2IVJ7_9PEZI|nr:uncharacterized protein SPBR_02622 [Sporothrix brasiliensis 5110]KIH93141.1 hypothetical protein SPBR_02622 [Sporothrix brasiliensis 5110]